MMSQRVVSLATILSCLALAIPQSVPCVNQSQDHIYVPNQSAFRLELLAPISTATNKKGDKFNCRVLDPKEFQDATVAGIIVRIKSGGSAGKTSEIAVVFESITLVDGRTARFDGQVMDVYDLVSSNKGQPSVRVSVGGIRALFVVGKGAAVGAAGGDGLGVLSVLSEKGRDLELNQGTQISVRTVRARTTEENAPEKAIRPSPASQPPQPRKEASRPIRASRPAAKPTRTQHASTTVDRYPTMECPSEVAVDQQFALQISLTKNLITPEVGVESGKTTKDKQLSLNLPDNSNQRSWKMDVVLSASDFLFSKGTNTSTILLDRDNDSSPAIFYLRPKSIQGPHLLSKVYATFWYEGVFLARVFRDIAILSPSDKKELAKHKPAQESASGSNAAEQSHQTLATAGGLTAAKASKEKVPLIEMNFDLEKPDLTVFVFNNEMIIDSPYLQPASYPYYEAEDLSRWLDLQYTQFARLAARGLLVQKHRKSTTTSTKEQASLAMRGFGRELYQKCAPSAFKEVFWKLFDKLGPRFKTIQIFSDNPILPWELMRPVRNDGTGEREFLGVEFTIGRWHLSKSISQLDRPPQIMPVEKIIVVAPRYEKDRNLAGQKTEIRSLEGYDGFTRLPGQLGSLKRLFENLPKAIIHFAGHGGIESTNQNINEYAIQLEDGILNLTTWKGMINSQNENHPFFFLNACDVGQAQRTANFVNGWAPAALEAGASGYIGALWSIGDSGAAEFAAQFYKALYAGLRNGNTSVASVLTETRRFFLQNSDPTFLAYIYYGDPHLKLATHYEK